MMSPLNRLYNRLRAEDGSVSIEAILMFPLLIWAWIAMYTFFEGLRENNINLKASYTIGDLLSRETSTIDMGYLNGMVDVFAWLTRTNQDVGLRVTVVRWNEADERHDLVWSRGLSGQADLTQEGVDAVLTPSIPILADADTAIVVETWAQFEPVMEIGLTDTTIYNVVVTPPRFSEQLVLEGINDGTGSNHDDGMDGAAGM